MDNEEVRDSLFPTEGHSKTMPSLDKASHFKGQRLELSNEVIASSRNRDPSFFCRL
jgi:hypothetical protein